MLVPVKWLKEYIDLKQTPEEIAEIMNAKILEVESIHHFGKEIHGVIVAEIKEVAKHPNADKLHVLKVDNGKELLQIVCGAQNVAPNKKIALATLGATLPGGFEIKQAKIRGVESFGMCCSEKELGLADESNGIMILEENAPLGKDLVKYLGLDDAALEVSILPNRGDCQSLKALAVELHAATGAQLTFPIVRRSYRAGNDITADIVIKDPDLCGRYMGAVLEVKIKPSPAWLQKHLKSIGLRPINNIVDITNFILHELGQPLHAFDHKKLKDGKIVVRRAKKAEKFKTLDDKELELSENMLVIADAEKPVALAGVMGGSNSCVDEFTTMILLEAAFFNPASIRSTSKATGVRTDSSLRFEKYISYEGVEEGFYRAMNLFQELAEAKLVSNIVDLEPGRPKPVVINFSPERANKVLGAKIPEAKMLSILKKLNFKVVHTGKKITVNVPSGRTHDIYREIDLIEEIARHYGYENITSKLPNLIVGNLEKQKDEKVVQVVHDILRASGFNEAISYSMTAPDIYKKIGIADQFNSPLKMTNPLSVEESIMRQHLLPQLLHALVNNLSRQTGNVFLYEIGKTYYREGEKLKIGGLLYGQLDSGSLNKTQQKHADFYYLKGVLENLFGNLGISMNSGNYSGSPFVHPGKSIEIKDLCFMGELNPQIITELGLLQPAYVFEIDLGELIKRAKIDKRFAPLPLYPAARRDIAFLASEKTTAQEIERVIKKAAGVIVEKVEIFDRYTGPGIPDGKVNLAYAINYRAADKTLNDEEINAAHQKIAQALVVELGIEFR